MLATYQTLSQIAHNEFSDIVVATTFVGGTPLSPNKLRLALSDGSYLDIWLSVDGDYSYHWEQRRQRGRITRWDNAPHHPHISTFPDHIHDGDEQTIIESQLSSMPQTALRSVLNFVRQLLTQS